MGVNNKERVLLRTLYEHGKKIDVDRKKISLAFEDGGTKATAVLEEPYKVRPKGEKRDIEVCHEKKKTFQDLYDCLELDVAREVNAVARFNRLTIKEKAQKIYKATRHTNYLELKRGQWNVVIEVIGKYGEAKFTVPTISNGVKSIEGALDKLELKFKAKKIEFKENPPPIQEIREVRCRKRPGQENRQQNEDDGCDKKESN